MKTTLLAGGIAVAAAIGIGTTLWARQSTKTEDAAETQTEPVAQVTTELARERVLTDILSAFGEVSPGQSVGLSFARAGQVTHLSVLPGDHVAKGAALATLEVDPSGREAYAQATNTLALARREADRLRQLLVLQLATQSQVDAAAKALQDATSTVKALDAQGGASASSTVTAPFDGLVASVAVAQGDRLQAGAPILQLARADALRVRIGIEPAQSRRVHAGTVASLVPITAATDQPVPIDAAVSSVQDIVDPKTQLVSAIIDLPRDAGARLVPGMKVRASLQVGSRTAISVPRNAVLTDERGDYVYQVAGGKARRTAVSKQLEVGGLVAIGGLTDPKLPVVIIGNYELQDGMAVKEAGR